MISRMCRHQRRHTSVVATASHRAWLSNSTYANRSPDASSRKMVYVSTPWSSSVASSSGQIGACRRWYSSDWPCWIDILNARRIIPLLRPSIYTEAVEFALRLPAQLKLRPTTALKLRPTTADDALRRPDDIRPPGSGHRRDLIVRSRLRAHRQLPRLDARRVRLLRAGLRRSRGSHGLRKDRARHRAGDYSHARLPSRWRAHLRADGGSLRAAAAADDRPRLLLDCRSRLRPRAELHLVPHPARALRHRHGRRVGRRCVARDGKGAAAV